MILSLDTQYNCSGNNMFILRDPCMRRPSLETNSESDGDWSVPLGAFKHASLHTEVRSAECFRIDSISIFVYNIIYHSLFTNKLKQKTRPSVLEKSSRPPESLHSCQHHALVLTAPQVPMETMAAALTYCTPCAHCSLKAEEIASTGSPFPIEKMQSCMEVRLMWNAKCT